jgi:hypothetical protein
MHIADVVPDVDVLLALEPEELGLRILQVLVAWPAHLSQIQLSGFVNGAPTGFPATNRADEIRQALREAWAWLEGQGLLIQDPRFMPGDMRVLSRKAIQNGVSVSAVPNATQRKNTCALSAVVSRGGGRCRNVLTLQPPNSV